MGILDGGMQIHMAILGKFRGEGDHNDKGKRNDSGRPFRRDNRYCYNRKGVNCDVCEKEDDNVDYYVGNWDNPDYQW